MGEERGSKQDEKWKDVTGRHRAHATSRSKVGEGLDAPGGRGRAK